MGLMADLQKRKVALAKAAGSTLAGTAQAAPVKKKRTHVGQYSVDELRDMPLDVFSKLSQD